MLRWLCALLAGLLVASYVSFALLRPMPALAPTAVFSYSRAASAVKLAWPKRGVAAVGAEGFGVLATRGSNTPLPTASTIKILTALSVLQKYPLELHEQGPTITITQVDLDSLAKFVAVDGSVVSVKLGEQLSEYQALQALLLPSANNIAETLARWAFGSIETYNSYANEYASSLGMSSTHVTDPSGFTPSTTSTPHDLVLLGEAALKNPVIADVINQATAILPVVGLVHNYNALLGQNGIIGVKTGNNDQDPGAYIVAAQQEVGDKHVVIVAAVMNGASLWGAMSSSLPLVASALNGFVVESPVVASTSIATYKAPWGGSIDAVARHPFSMITWSDSITSATVQVKKLSVPARKGESVGTLTIHNSITGDTVLNLTTKQSAPEPNIWWKLVHLVR